jgi:3'5'-cyclic nucleotide phosphodiesterase
MERHHFNHAMGILNSSGLNILSKLNQDDYKKCLKLIEKCILATDLALFLANQVRFINERKNFHHLLKRKL